MSRIVHRKGDLYRLWSVPVETYITFPMNRQEVVAFIREDAATIAEEKFEADEKAGKHQVHEDWVKGRVNE